MIAIPDKAILKFVHAVLFLFGVLSMTGNAFSFEEEQGARWLKAFGNVPPLQIPKTVEQWKSHRDDIRKKLKTLLGDLPARPSPAAVKVISREDKTDHWQETFEFENGAGETVRGYCFLPKSAKPTAKAPAILYCHWHGGQYDIGKNEMVQTNATPVPPGPTLARAGFVVLGVDAPCFGERNGKGPDGPNQKGANGELTAAKFHLWTGRTLWGMVIRDDLFALDYLCSRPEVDPERIGVTGISMGSTRAWWIMAVDDRPKVAVCVACMTRYQDLISQGMLKAHGIYYFVPGMLKHFDSEAVIACAAPRPMLFMTGDSDGGSPVSGVKAIGETVRKIYSIHGSEAESQFVNEIYAGVGHVYLPAMWNKTVVWMDRWLKVKK